MGHISSLGYVVIAASDLPAWGEFAKNILGMRVEARGEDTLALQMDDRVQRLLIELGDQDDIHSLGWEFVNATALYNYIEKLKANGTDCFELSDEDTAKRAVEVAYACTDPSGIVHEFYYGPQFLPLSKNFRSDLLTGSGFVTDELGVGHAMLVASDYKASVDFYTKVLGLNITDYIRDSELFPGVTIDATFMHTKTGRHHSLATAAMPSPKKLNHLMIQVESLDDLGLAYDRVRKANIPLILDLGHHPNDKMTSFYMVTPSGFGLEFGWGGIVVDDNWNIKSYSQLSDWGHALQLTPPQE